MKYRIQIELDSGEGQGPPNCIINVVDSIPVGILAAAAAQLAHLAYKSSPEESKGEVLGMVQEAIERGDKAIQRFPQN